MRSTPVDELSDLLARHATTSALTDTYERTRVAWSRLNKKQLELSRLDQHEPLVAITDLLNGTNEIMGQALRSIGPRVLEQRQ
jgi:hypothetical protein